MNANLDQAYANSLHGAYAFRIHGAVHHLISSSLLPENNDNHQPKFAQIYIFDAENELSNRINVAGNRTINESTMNSLQQMMHDFNPFVRSFKTMNEIASEQPGGIRDLKLILKAEGTPDSRRYNGPTGSEQIGVLIVGGESNINEEPKHRDIVLRLKGPGSHLDRINEIHQHYDPLQYVLMFPTGDSGWYHTIRSYVDNHTMEIDEATTSTDNQNVIVDGETNAERERDGEANTNSINDHVTIMQYYSSRLMVRQTSPNASIPRNEQMGLHSFGKLFHQYVVDMYAKMEQQRLNFIRHNQSSLRAEVYNGLRDAVRLDDNDMSSIGKRVVLPSTFVGGPRFMAQLYQDAMSLVRRFGKPDLFITFTCNPMWPEITDALLINQTANDRPDLCARVFNLKLKALLNDIVKNSVLGKVVAYVYSIEFQKRGLPHCHMLFILDSNDKPRSTDDIDKIVSAEIPDPLTHPLAYETISKSMVHGPCGVLNPSAPCMKNGRCSKKYPFNFCNETIADSTEFGTKLCYRRRMMNERVLLRESGNVTIDNRWIVPHNLFLAAKYNAHINVEICNQVNSIKYVYKYIYKGHDRAQVYMGSVDERQDEIKNFLDARYVSAAESCWRIFSYPMHKEFPASQRLDIHLEGERRVYFDENDSPQDVLARQTPDSTLSAWFKYNQNHPNDMVAKNTLYPDFCEKFTFHKRDRAWKPRQRGFGGIVGRIYTVSPRDTEKFYMRMLLYKIPGAKSYADLKTYDGHTYQSYQATARAMGLLTDDSEWSSTMREACLTMFAPSLRQLFCTLIVFSELSDPFQLWLEYKDKMCEDYLYAKQNEARIQNLEVPETTTEEMHGYCLLDMNDILDAHRFDLKTKDGFKDIFPNHDSRLADNAERAHAIEVLHTQLYRQSLEEVDPDTLIFNESQKLVYNAVKQTALSDVNHATEPKIFFVDGPGGTGKTFLFNALLDCVRRTNNIAISVASSGTAALLLKGGRTAHSTFKIPLSIDSNSLCDMTPRSKIAEFIKRSRLIVWDECSMVSKDLVETVDRSFRDILKNDVPFGGCLIVFGGDFRQVLPIIPKASRSEIVAQSLNRSNFWRHVKVMKLEINMRVRQALLANDTSFATELQQFADYLLEIGEGRIRTIALANNCPSDYIPIPNNMHMPDFNLLNLLKAVYPDIRSNSSNLDYFVSRVILTTKNKDVSVINNLLLDCVQGNVVRYFSHDSSLSNQDQLEVPVEILNSIENGSIPPHELQLKIGTPIIAIRNIDPAGGVCNGTRLIVKSLGRRIIEAVIATGPKKGQIAYIPKIKFSITATDANCPYDFSRTQFPVKLAFSMTINKAQGQTLDLIGLYLPCHVFSHGQLYVALSRVKTPSSVKIMVDPQISKVVNHEGHFTHNIVYNEVFQ